MKHQKAGITLIELVLVLAMSAIILFALLPGISPMYKYFGRNQARQLASLDARRCMETINQVMSIGKASSLVISTPASTPTVLYSNAQFVGVDGSSYTITWSTAPMNTVQLFKTPPGSTVTNDSILASYVSLLTFTNDQKDPGVVYVALQITRPMDSSGSPDSFYTILMPKQTIVMSAP